MKNYYWLFFTIVISACNLNDKKQSTNKYSIEYTEYEDKIVVDSISEDYIYNIFQMKDSEIKHVYKWTKDSCLIHYNSLYLDSTFYSINYKSCSERVQKGNNIIVNEFTHDSDSGYIKMFIARPWYLSDSLKLNIISNKNEKVDTIAKNYNPKREWVIVESGQLEEGTTISIRTEMAKDLISEKIIVL